MILPAALISSALSAMTLLPLTVMSWPDCTSTVLPPTLEPACRVWLLALWLLLDLLEKKPLELLALLAFELLAVWVVE